MPLGYLVQKGYSVKWEGDHLELMDQHGRHWRLPHGGGEEGLGAHQGVGDGGAEVPDEVDGATW